MKEEIKEWIEEIRLIGNQAWKYYDKQKYLAEVIVGETEDKIKKAKEEVVSVTEKVLAIPIRRSNVFSLFKEEIDIWEQYIKKLRGEK